MLISILNFNLYLKWLWFLCTNRHILPPHTAMSILPLFLFQNVCLAVKVRRTSHLDYQSHRLMQIIMVQFLLKVQVYLQTVLRMTWMILIQEELLPGSPTLQLLILLMYSFKRIIYSFMWSINYGAYFTVMYVIHANCTFELQAFQVHIGGGIKYLC